MMESVRASLEERDLIIYVVDATERFGEEDRRALSMLRPNGPPVVLVFNKIDAVRAKHDLLPLMDEYSKQFDFVATLPISALKDDGLEKLRQEVISRMPEGPEYFPPDHVTDQPARFLAAELIREKILTATRQEIPHATTVIIDKWEETPAIVRMYATIYVERDGQKAIIIGAKGAMLKKIGTLAREEMESIFGIRIYLDLHVKVESRWRESAAFLNTLDWRTMAGRDDK
jgi:GTP-binding protein Era